MISLLNLKRELGLLLAVLLLQQSNFARATEQVVPLDLFNVPDDMEVILWAQSPLLNNPTNMDIDADGRIWVAQGVNYRRHAGRDPGGDRIVVVEDTDGDGVADKSWTFVQEPDIIAPLGVAVIDNKVFVSNAPDLIVYTDVDRDMVFNPAIDKREVLLTGFNGNNHDHALHSVTVGPDGLLYFSHGNTGALVTDRSGQAFRIGSFYDKGKMPGALDIYGVNPNEYSGAMSDDGHVYVGGFTARINPDGTNLEVIGHNYRNSYEQTISSYGDVFQNDNDDPPACRTSYVLEYGSAGFFSRDGLTSWRTDTRPGQSTQIAEWRQEDPGIMPAGDVYGSGSPTGIVLYEGDLFGQQWRGTLLSCEAARNTIFGYKPEPENATFNLDRFNFLSTQAEADIDKAGSRSKSLKGYFRPSDIAVGPDGALYVADWFDPRVGGHADLDDTMSGAIYRIAPKGARLTIPTFDASTVDGQIEALKSPAVNVRAIGFYGLKARGDVVVPAVAKLLTDDNPFIRGRAVWLLAQLGSKGLALAERQLKSEDARMRSAAYQAIRRVDPALALKHATKLAKDPSPGLRREVAVSLRDVPIDQSREILLELAEGYDGSDRTYLEAWGIGCMGKELDIYHALAAKNEQNDSTKWSPSYAGLIWRLTPRGAEADLANRVLSESLGYTQRLASLTALAFIDSQEAANEMLRFLDTLDGPLHEQAEWWLLSLRASRWAAFGVGDSLKKRDLYNPDAIQLSAIVMPPKNPDNYISAEAVLALTGDAERGKIKIAVCYMCHQIDEVGAEFGPALTGWGKQQPLDIVIASIVNPDADIAHGYGGSEIELKDGRRIQGLVESNADPVVIRSQGGIVQKVPRNRVREITKVRSSLMLSADQLGLTAQDVADIAAYMQK